MIIVGLDLGTKTGWAILIDGTIESGTWDFSPRRFDGGGMRFLRFRWHLSELLGTMAGPIEIYFEEVRAHKGVDAAHIYGGFMAHLTSICEEMKIPYLGIPVGTIKRTATGKGNCNKAAMIAAAKRKWPDFTGDDNEADARWIVATVTSGRI